MFHVKQGKQPTAQQLFDQKVQRQLATRIRDGIRHCEDNALDQITDIIKQWREGQKKTDQAALKEIEHVISVMETTTFALQQIIDPDLQQSSNGQEP